MPLEEPNGIEEAQEKPVMEERAGTDYESAPAEQPKKKKIKRKANRAPQSEVTSKKKKVAVGPTTSKKAKVPLMGRERIAVTAELGLPIDFPIHAFMERSIVALCFQNACIGPEVIHPQSVLTFTKRNGLKTMARLSCRMALSVSTQNPLMKCLNLRMRRCQEIGSSVPLQQTT